MGKEIYLLVDYPKSKRNLTERKSAKQEDREKILSVVRQFGQEFFDGDRKYGYGGYYYNPRFWGPVVPLLQKHYSLTKESKVLDVGCAKGFLLHDLSRLIPGIIVAGLDISQYAIDNSKEDVKPFLKVGNAIELPYEDDSYDLVISINTVHNLEENKCKRSLLEIERVSRKDKFVTVDAYRNKEEKDRMDMWNITAQTYMSVDEWKDYFKDIGYSGDYYWFFP